MILRPSDPPPIREDEAAVWCRTCQDDTWHHLQIGNYVSTKSCDECGAISDYEEGAS